MAEQVNHPQHYNEHPAGIECIEVVEHFNFNIGNAIKYLWRVGLKPGEDPGTALQKARWYIDREIERTDAASVRAGHGGEESSGGDDALPGGYGSAGTRPFGAGQSGGVRLRPQNISGGDEVESTVRGRHAT